MSGPQQSNDAGDSGARRAYVPEDIAIPSFYRQDHQTPASSQSASRAFEHRPWSTMLIVMQSVGVVLLLVGLSLLAGVDDQSFQDAARPVYVATVAKIVLGITMVALLVVGCGRAKAGKPRMLAIMALVTVVFAVVDMLIIFLDFSGEMDFSGEKVLGFVINGFAVFAGVKLANKLDKRVSVAD